MTKKELSEKIERLEKKIDENKYSILDKIRELKEETI
jgi:hypothetical protein